MAYRFIMLFFLVLCWGCDATHTFVIPKYSARSTEYIDSNLKILFQKVEKGLASIEFDKKEPLFVIPMRPMGEDHPLLKQKMDLVLKKRMKKSTYAYDFVDVPDDAFAQLGCNQVTLTETFLSKPGTSSLRYLLTKQYNVLNENIFVCITVSDIATDKTLLTYDFYYPIDSSVQQLLNQGEGTIAPSVQTE